VVGNVTSTSYLHQKLEPNTLHSYKVMAYSSVNESRWSRVITQITAPTPPENLVAEAETHEILISWDDVEGVIGYEILVDEEEIIEVSVSEFRHIGLEPNTWHNYKVRSINEGGFSEWSEELQQIINKDYS